MVGKRHLSGMMKSLSQNRMKCLVNKRRFAASRNTCHTDKCTQWKIQIDIFQVVTRCSPENKKFTIASPPFFRDVYPAFIAEIS